MATGTLVSVEEYLRTSYRPDRDYVDGELLQRNLGELSHGRVQAIVTGWFLRHESRWRMKVVTEVRLQVKVNSFRIPDVISSHAPREEVVKTPPLLCIEILSPKDRMGQYI